MATEVTTVTYSCSCNFDDDGGTCAYCKRGFDNLSHFIRHVTHSKACKAHYDPRTIESFKKTSRQISKKKWYHYIFLTLVTTEGYFDYKDDDDLDSKMSNAYWSVIKVEVSKLFDANIELQTSMKTVMEEILKKQFDSCDLTYTTDE